MSEETRNWNELAAEVERLTNHVNMLTEQLAQARATIANMQRANDVAGSIDGVRTKSVDHRTRRYQRQK